MLFCHERREQITHRRTIVKNDRSNLLTVTTTVNRYCHSIKKSNWAKSDGSDSLLSIKRGETVKNCQKHLKNTFFRANRSFFESDFPESQANLWGRSFLKKSKAIRSWSLFCKERQEKCREQWERIDHSLSLIWAIFSVRAKSERAESRPWVNLPSKFQMQLSPHAEFWFDCTQLHTVHSWAQITNNLASANRYPF